MSYLGMAKLTFTTIGAHAAYAQANCTFRYVNGERRLLVTGAPRGTTGTPGTSHNPPILYECRIPATLTSLNTTAPELQVVRSWSALNWVSGYVMDTTPGTNGTRLGGIWWDETRQVLWTVMLYNYGGLDDPAWLGANQLNDDGTVTARGSWQHPSGGQMYRTGCWFIDAAPPSVRAASPGVEIVVGAGTGSTTAEGNVGPGLYGIVPPTLDTTGRLAASSYKTLIGYSSYANPTLTVTDYSMRRPGDYTSLTGGLIAPPVGTGPYDGYCVASSDNMFGMNWIEGTRKWGVVTFGRRARPNVFGWYKSGNGSLLNFVWDSSMPASSQQWSGHQFYSDRGVAGYILGSHVTNGVIDDPDAMGMEPWGLIFDPSEPLQVLAGTRLPYDVRYVSTFNWETLWGVPRRIPVQIGTYPNNGGWQDPICELPTNGWGRSAYDPISKTLVWGQVSTAANTGNAPTFQFWDMSALYS